MPDAAIAALKQGRKIRLRLEITASQGIASGTS
jgi:hypothetical protein